MKRDTRGMLGGGPASQNPRLTPKQIRRPLTSHRHLDVIALSTDVCVLTAFFPKIRADERIGRAIRILRESTRAHATCGMDNFALANRLHRFKTTTRFQRSG